MYAPIPLALKRSVASVTGMLDLIDRAHQKVRRAVSARQCVWIGGEIPVVSKLSACVFVARLRIFVVAVVASHPKRMFTQQSMKNCRFPG